LSELEVWNKNYNESLKAK